MTIHCSGMYIFAYCPPMDMYYGIEKVLKYEPDY